MEPTVHIFASSNTELHDRNKEIQTFISSFPEKQKFLLVTDEPIVHRQLGYNSRKIQVHYSKQSDYIYNLLFAGLFIKQSEDTDVSEPIKKEIHEDGMKILDTLIIQGIVRDSEIRDLRESQISTLLLMKLENEIRKLESPIMNKEVINKLLEEIDKYCNHNFDNHFIVQPLADISAINLFIKFAELYSKYPDKHFIITSSMDSFPNFIDIIYERHPLIPTKISPSPLITVTYQNMRINIRRGKFIEEKNLTKPFKREIHDKTSSYNYIYIPIVRDAEYSSEYKSYVLPVKSTDSFIMNHSSHKT
jgi:hypothetical protein